MKIRCKKMLAAGVFGCMAVPFVVGAAQAVELINDAGLLTVLKKNQVVSERDLNAIKNEYPKLEVNGNLQFQYLYASGDAISPKVHEMNLNRLNLSILGRTSEMMSVLIEPEFGKNQPSLRDAYVALRSPVLGLYVGNHRVPFGQDTLQNDNGLMFAERNLPSRIAPNRLTGVSGTLKFWGNRLLAQGGVWGSRLNTQAEADLLNSRLADSQIFSPASGTGNGRSLMVQAARLGFSSSARDDFFSPARPVSSEPGSDDKPLLAFVAGVSLFNSVAATDVGAATGVTGLNGATGFEGDVSVRFRRLTGEAEYASRKLEWWRYNPQTISTLTSSSQSSYALQANLELTGGLSGSARIESFVYDGGKKLKGAFGQDADNWTSLGLSYFSKLHNTKVQFNYVMKKESMPAGAAAPSNNALIVQTTTNF